MSARAGQTEVREAGHAGSYMSALLMIYMSVHDLYPLYINPFVNLFVRREGKSISFPRQLHSVFTASLIKLHR